MGRKAVVVPEKQERLDKIKEKYNNMEMSDDTAKKIRRFEITNGILKAATVAASLYTVLDWASLDNTPAVDEMIETGVSGLLGYGSVVCENKIDELAKTGEASIDMDEVVELTNQLTKAASSYKAAKSRAA